MAEEEHIPLTDDVSSVSSNASSLSAASTASISLPSTSSTDDNALVRIFSEIFNEMNTDEQSFYVDKFIEKLDENGKITLKKKLMQYRPCAIEVLKNPFELKRYCTSAGLVEQSDTLPAYIAMIKNFEFPKPDPKNPTLSLQKLEHLSLLIFKNIMSTVTCTFFADNVSFENFKCTKTIIGSKDPPSNIELKELQDVLKANGMLTNALSTQIRLGTITKHMDPFGTADEFKLKYLRRLFAFNFNDAIIVMTILKTEGTTYTTKFGLYIPKDGTNYEWTSVSNNMRILHACGDNKIDYSISPFFTKEGGRRRRSKLTKNARKARKTRKTRKTRKPRRRTTKKNKSRRN